VMVSVILSVMGSVTVNGSVIVKVFSSFDKSSFILFSVLNNKLFLMEIVNFVT
jgi:hypothetical protein